MKWYQILFMILWVYVAANLIGRAIANARDLRALRNGMNENLCLLIKQLKKYDKEILELRAEVPSSALAANPGGGTGPVILPVDPSGALAKIEELKAKRVAILAVISTITAQDPYVIYCKPCDCEKKENGTGVGNPPPPPPPPDTTSVVGPVNGGFNGARAGVNGGIY